MFDTDLLAQDLAGTLNSLAASVGRDRTVDWLLGNSLPLSDEWKDSDLCMKLQGDELSLSVIGLVNSILKQAGSSVVICVDADALQTGSSPLFRLWADLETD